MSLVSYAVGIIYLFLQTLVAAKQYQNSNRLILFILFLFVVLGTSIQVLLPQLYLSWLCISFAIGLYYIYFCELYHQIDGLTELLNRRSYESYLNKIQNKKNVTIFIFDIDDFKSVNDQYGHPFGDFCIMAISSCIKEVFYKTGLCFRTGGDEFCVISETQNHYAIQRAYHRFLREIELKRKKEKRLPMVSVGYSCYCSESGSIDEAISEADKRMYYFKQRRKATSSSPSQSEIDSNNLI